MYVHPVRPSGRSGRPSGPYGRPSGPTDKPLGPFGRPSGPSGRHSDPSSRPSDPSGSLPSDPLDGQWKDDTALDMMHICLLMNDERLMMPLRNPNMMTVLTVIDRQTAGWTDAPAYWDAIDASKR